MSKESDLYDQADKLKEAGDLEGAAAKFEELLTESPDYALGHSGIAVVLQRLDKHEPAIDHAKQVCELQPDDPFGFMALSVTYQRAYAATGEMMFIPLAEEAMERSRQVQMGGQ